MFIKRFGIKKTLLFLGIVINTIMIGGLTYATVQITSPASSEWCGPKKSGCSKILSVHLSNNPENMSCPAAVTATCTGFGCGGSSGGGGGTTGSAP